MEIAPYKPIIGLEVHVQLATASKMFSAESATYGREPNSVTSPFSLAYPGTLPLVNKKAVEATIKLGLSCGSTISGRLAFCRKNYFYPDLPKGFQITQDEYPLCSGGFLQYISDSGQSRKIQLRRIHMEEDTAKSIHNEVLEVTMLDFNRAGVPLAEVVTEPELHSSAEAAHAVAHMRRLVRYLGISDGNMETGSLRCDVNISLMHPKNGLSGSVVELKNINTIQGVRKGVDHEMERQHRILKAGGVVQPETRLYQKESGSSRVLRRKETLEDYRYFPEPDLPPLAITDQWLEAIRQQLPKPIMEWYRECRTRYNLAHVEALQLMESAEESRYYASVFQQTKAPRKAYFLLSGPLRKMLESRRRTLATSGIPDTAIVQVIDAVADGVVSHDIAVKQVLPALAEDPRMPVEVLLRRSMEQKEDTGVVEGTLQSLFRQYPDKIGLYRQGKKGIADMFVGMVMQSLRGQADPKMVRRLVLKMLEDKKKR